MTARAMQPRYLMILDDLPCEEREIKLKEVIYLYSNYMQTCYDAKELLANSLNELLKITEEDDNSEQN